MIDAVLRVTQNGCPKHELCEPEMALFSILQLVRQDRRLSTFSTALDLSDLASYMDSQPHVTVFAPTNLAFSRLPDGKLRAWLSQPQMLREVLLHHLVHQRLNLRDLISSRTVSTAGNALLRIEASATHVKVAEATIENCDISASNGVLHVVGAVLAAVAPLPAAQHVPSRDSS
jgi:transforming growth factor-beta-induced protein